MHNLAGTVDPGITAETYAVPIINNMFEGLLAYDADNNIIPGSAESWEISNDGRVFTFHLRKGLKWSDGSPLTAEDFRYSYIRVINPETASLHSELILPYVVGAQEFFEGKAGEGSVGIEAVDDLTLKITLKAPVPFFLALLASHTFYPVQRATVEANGDKWTLSAETFISNGPFKVSAVNFKESYEFVKNEHYWNAANVKLDRLTFVYITDTSTALTAFRAGEIDGFWEAPASDLPALRAESDELVTVRAFGTTYHLMNNRVPPFDNPLVRKAFNLAIDRRAIIEDVLGTNDIPAYSLVSPGYMVDGKDVTEGRSTYELAPNAQPEAARAALAEAGYPDGKGFPPIEYYYSTNDTYKKTVEALSAMLKANLNVEITLKTADWAVYLSDVTAGKFQIGNMGWGGGYLHPMTFLPLLVTDAVDNYGGYSNPEYDALVAKIQSTADPAKGADLIRKAEDVSMKDYPLLPLFHRSYSYMMRRGITGYFRNPLNNLFFRDAYVTE
jgi:oligopeptide transport system substrate-binding protein